MKLIYKGKTKDVYAAEDENLCILKFKDDVTGTDGVFDPGANTVGLTIDGVGKSGLKMTTFFFELMNEKGIATHFVESDIDAQTMTVKKATFFGNGLEVICRYKAVGSFYRRYADLCEEGQDLDRFVEVTLKDDERGDPTISEDALDMLGVLTKDEYQILKNTTVQVCDIVKDELAKKDLHLYDIKLEFGRDSNGEIMLIDEISGGNMRVYKGGEYVDPLELEKIFLD